MLLVFSFYRNLILQVITFLNSKKHQPVSINSFKCNIQPVTTFLLYDIFQTLKAIDWL